VPQAKPPVTARAGRLRCSSRVLCEEEPELFDHKRFDNYVFEDIPLDCDIFVVSDEYMHEYEAMMLRLFEGGEYSPVGYVSYAAVNAVGIDHADLSWYANVIDRFHEITVALPRDQFIACVGSRWCDEKPRIFVRHEWIDELHLRSYSIFVLVDAVGVKAALATGRITRDRLLGLRRRVDDLAGLHADVSFISFADSLLLKSNWSVGDFRRGVKCSYSPEQFIGLVSEIDRIYQEALGLPTYAIFAQGSNEYYQDPLLHISPSKNHVCLNSLGVPFAQIMEIENAARRAIRDNVHGPFELYMDEQYYHSLGFAHGFEKWKVDHFEYQTRMKTTPSSYFCMARDYLVGHMEKAGDR
jgi:hypothetical protein